jgi:hypothetical protein
MTLSIYDFHKRKRNEKIIEMDIRKSRVFQEPQLLSLDGSTTFPWAGLGLKEFNETWAYNPYYAYGQFDHANEVRVERIKEGIL